jgi:hypothetical protein
LTSQFAAGLARPLESGDRITRRGVFEQFVERLQNAWLFFSTLGRPPPGRRTPDQIPCLGCSTSCRPR